MIPKDYITAWRAQAPWRLDAQVEQDLVISRAIVDLFSVPEVASSLVFRGGTALYKIYLTPAVRYSEDIDLVQIRAEPIGETLDRARAALDPWLGQPRRVFKEGRVNLVYRFESEDAPPLKLRLKVEINTREHFTVLGVKLETVSARRRVRRYVQVQGTERIYFKSFRDPRVISRRSGQPFADVEALLKVDRVERRS